MRRGSSRFWTSTPWRFLTGSETTGAIRSFVLENPSIGIIFIVPKRKEVVRVSGVAEIGQDPDLLATMAVNGKVPTLALIVRVKEAFFHCGKSMMRSGMWEPEKWASIDGLPSYAQALKDHGKMSGDLADIQCVVDNNENNRMY